MREPRLRSQRHSGPAAAGLAASCRSDVSSPHCAARRPSAPEDPTRMKNQPPGHTGRHFLQIPGPTNVPDRVLHAMAFPTIDHRGPDFAELGKAVVAGLKRVLQTDGTVVIYPSSGTGPWEAALVNTLSP